ncbi:MAG: hypothetical protein QXP28_05155 [Archaeoglobaceae archaeon]
MISMRIGALMALLFLIPSLVLAVDVDKFTGVTLLPPQNPPIVAKLSPMSVYWLDFSELGVDTDGDGFKEAIVEVSVPSMPKDRWMDIFLSTHYGRGKISATLITPTPINFEKKEWFSLKVIDFDMMGYLRALSSFLANYLRRC